ncbi:hypothetical protein MGG_02670 [Pyricularia oryzae 70-15]|uniref:Uncharacterized protein n=1 Tax=Pyricularia oryzae (strain 70-15 / ATCC MYA-4617 / FGSC 8958) TaxID=242507 RepID=G4NJE7_PYRO7|nr:uncharacterized protein MGG_02670 [Pyricularia oryzae 70-15]EHA46361.1 hypothetical protein MGG_02670 [Pyricularia oryzae 70-15]KAI7929902.1 hypothetical protein M9X92_001020 [Pyricularia oryzae]KAI7930514.1 hypothetical protein M0657_001634 [Pyricularia oryzae]
MACPIPSDQIRQNLERSAREKGFCSPFQLGGPYKLGSHIENPTVGNGDLKHPEPDFYFACPPNKSYIFSVARKSGHGGHGRPSGIRLQGGFLPYRDITADTSEHTWYRASQLQKTHPDICKKVNKRPKEWEDLYDYFDGEDIYQMGAYNAWCVVNLLYEMNLHISEDIEAEWKKLMDLALYEWLANFDDAKEKLLAFDRHKTTRSILTVLDDASNVFDLDALTRNQKAMLAIRTGLLREKLLAESTENSGVTVPTQFKPTLRVPEATHDHYVNMPLSAPPAVSYFQTQSTQPQSSQIPASTPVLCSTLSDETRSSFKEETKGPKNDYPKTPEHGRFHSRSNHVSPVKFPQHRQHAPTAPVPVFFGSHSPDKGDQRGQVPAPSQPVQRGVSAPFGFQSQQQFPVAVPQGYQGPQMQPPPVMPEQNHRVRFHPSSSVDNNQAYSNKQQPARSRHAQQPSNGNMSHRSRNSSTSPQKNGTWEPRDVPNSIHGPVVCRPGSRRDSTCHDGGSNLSLNSETRHASSSVLEDRQNLPHGQHNGHHHKQQLCANHHLGPFEPSVECECRACCERSRSVIVFFDKESVAESHLEDLRRIFSHWGQIEHACILSRRPYYHHKATFEVAAVRYHSDSVPPAVLRDMLPSRPCRLGNSIVRARHPKGSKHFKGYPTSPNRRRNSVANSAAASGSRPSHQYPGQANHSMPPPSWPANDKQVNGNGPNHGRHAKKPAHVGQLTLGRDQQQPQYGNMGQGQTGLPTPPMSANLNIPAPPVQASVHNMVGLPYQMAPLPTGMSTYAHNQPPFNSVTTYPSMASAPLPGQATFAYHPQPAPHNLPQQAGPFLGLPAPPAVPAVAAVPGPGLPVKPMVVASANGGQSVSSQTGKDTRHNSITVSREGSHKKQVPSNKVQPPLAGSPMTQKEFAENGKVEATKTNEPKKVPTAIVTDLHGQADSGSSTANSSFVILTPGSSFNSASNENSPSRTQPEPEARDRGVIDYGTVRIRIKKNLGPSSLFNEWMVSAENEASDTEGTVIEPSADAEQGDVVVVSTDTSNGKGLPQADLHSVMPADEKSGNPDLRSDGGRHVSATTNADINATGMPLAGDHEQHDVPQKQSGPKKGKNKKKNKAKQQQGQESTATSSVVDRNEAHFAADGNQNYGQETGVQGQDGQDKKSWKKNKRNHPKKTFQAPSEKSDGSRAMSLASGPSGRVTPEPAVHDNQAGGTAAEAKPAATNGPPSPPHGTAGLAVTKTRAGREGPATLAHDDIPVIAPPSVQTGPDSSPFASQKDEITRQLSDREPAVSTVMTKPPPKLMITQTSRSTTLPAGFDPFPRPLRTATPNAATVAAKQDQPKLPPAPPPAPARELTPPATPKKDPSSSDPPPVQADQVELPPSPPSSRQPSFNPNAQVFVSGGARQPSQFSQPAASQPAEQQEAKKFQKKKKPAKKPQKHQQNQGHQQNQEEKPAVPKTSNEFMNSTNWRATAPAASPQKASGVQKPQEAAKSQSAAATVNNNTSNSNRNADRSVTPSTPPEPAYKKGDKVDVSKGETFLKHRFNVMSELRGRSQKEDRSSRLTSSTSTSAPVQGGAVDSSTSSFAAKARNSDNGKPIPSPESFNAWPSLPSRPGTDQPDASLLTPRGGGLKRDGEKKASSPVSSEKSAGTAAAEAKGSRVATSTLLSLKLTQHKTRAMSSAN